MPSSRAIEGLGNVFSAFKRKAHGSRSNDNLFAKLYFNTGQLDLPVTR